jgi:hypothetical protein
MRVASWLLGFALITSAASADAKVRLWVRVRRALQSAYAKLPRALQRPNHELEHALASALVADRSTRVGWAERSPREVVLARMTRKLAKRELARARRASKRPAVQFIKPPALTRAPREVRPQLAHTVALLRRMVAETEAAGDPVLARMLALHYNRELARGLDLEQYENEVPSPSHFRDSRLRVLPPPRGSTRAVVVRSRQPAEINLRELVDAARRLGIPAGEIAVLDLRLESNRDTEWVRAAQNRDLGQIHVFHQPLIEHAVPTDDDVRAAVQLVLDPRFKLVDIHCKGGRGRTGTIIAAIRIVVDGWDVERALDEAKQLDLSGPLQEFYIRDLAQRWQDGEFRL